MLEAARLFVTVGANTREAERGLQSFQQRLNNAARNLTLTGGMMTAGVTLPLLAVGRSALNMAGDYEQSMNILQQVTGASADTMSALNEQALALGAETVFSAGEAAAGMLELAKAGMSAEQVMAAIPGVMDLAAAAGIGLSEAGGITAAALNAFGLAAEESVRVADMLAAGANASAADMSDLGAGIQQAGFAFDMANQPLENLVASLAILTNVGLTGSDAGTALKNAFMRMMNPTQEAIGVMNELGLSFYDAQGNMLQLPAIIDNLNTAMAGLTPQQRDAALATIFLSDGMKAMIPLMSAGTDGFYEMVGSVTEVGAASDVANARMGGLKGGFEELAGSAESFLIGAAQPLLGTLGDMARGAADAISWFGALPQPVIDATLAFLGVLAATGPVIAGLGAMAGAVGFLLTPLGLIVAASALLAAAWAADFGGIQAMTATVAGQVQQGFQTMLGSAQQVASGIATAFGNTSFPSIKTLWEQFKGGDFQTVATTIRDTAFDLMVNLNTELNITGQAEQLRGQLTGLANAISTAVSGLDFGGARAKLDGLRDGVLSSLSAAIESVDFGQASTSFSGLVSGLTEAVNSLDLTGIDWAATFQRILLGPLGTALTAVQWVVGSENFAGLTTAVRGAFGEINWGEIGTSLVGLGTAVRTQLGAVVTDMASDLSAALPDVQFSFTGMVTSMTNAINNQDWTALGSGLVSSIGTGFNAVMAADVSWAENAANNFATSVRTAFASVDWGALDSALVGLATAVREAIYGLATGIGQEINLSLPDIQWDAIMEKFTWADWMQTLSWDTWVGSLSWEEFVAGIEWASFVPGVSWNSFVPNLSWGAFVDGLNWGSFIPDVSWGSFVPSLDWSRFISWLNIPGFASGTNFAPGGLAIVGEQGPELVNLPRGSRVYDHHETAAMVSGGGGITVNVHVASVASEIDMHSLAHRVAREIQRKMR
jgi:TP901 family phage tail tape measure protein